MARRPTMYDIAVACGVSQATVSLVLSDAPGTRISPTTREAVLRQARAVGYARPRRAVGRRPLLAMLLNDASASPHVGGLIDGAAEAAGDLGYALSCLATAADPEAERAAFGHLGGQDVAGVIYARLITQRVDPPAALARWPAVLLNCHAPGAPYPSVVPGDRAAGLAATLALLDVGHRRVAFVGGEDALEAGRERLAGYRQALARRGLPFDPALVVKGSWSPSGGYDALGRLLALADPPTAVFCYCDRTALGVYEAAADAGLAVPRDLSVIGFDDESFAADMRPALTTVELPHREMAAHAVARLARLIAAPARAARARTLRFRCPLVPRLSVGAPAARARRPAARGLAAG